MATAMAGNVRDVINGVEELVKNIKRKRDLVLERMRGRPCLETTQVSLLVTTLVDQVLDNAGQDTDFALISCVTGDRHSHREELAAAKQLEHKWRVKATELEVNLQTAVADKTRIQKHCSKLMANLENNTEKHKNEVNELKKTIESLEKTVRDLNSELIRKEVELCVRPIRTIKTEFKPRIKSESDSTIIQAFVTEVPVEQVVTNGVSVDNHITDESNGDIESGNPSEQLPPVTYNVPDSDGESDDGQSADGETSFLRERCLSSKLSISLGSRVETRLVGLDSDGEEEDSGPEAEEPLVVSSDEMPAEENGTVEESDKDNFCEVGSRGQKMGSKPSNIPKNPQPVRDPSVEEPADENNERKSPENKSESKATLTIIGYESSESEEEPVPVPRVTRSQKKKWSRIRSRIRSRSRSSSFPPEEAVTTRFREAITSRFRSLRSAGSAQIEDLRPKRTTRAAKLAPKSSKRETIKYWLGLRVVASEDESDSADSIVDLTPQTSRSPARNQTVKSEPKPKRAKSPVARRLSQPSTVSYENVCVNCGYSNARRNQMTHHIRMCKKKKPEHTCHLCPAVYFTSAGIKVHLKTKHQILNPTTPVKTRHANRPAPPPTDRKLRKKDQTNSRSKQSNTSVTSSAS